jgi:hypothetical protein
MHKGHSVHPRSAAGGVARGPIVLVHWYNIHNDQGPATYHILAPVLAEADVNELLVKDSSGLEVRGWLAHQGDSCSSKRHAQCTYVISCVGQAVRQADTLSLQVTLAGCHLGCHTKLLLGAAASLIGHIDNTN